jgi:hypothetical protein
MRALSEIRDAFAGRGTIASTDLLMRLAAADPGGYGAWDCHDLSALLGAHGVTRHRVAIDGDKRKLVGYLLDNVTSALAGLAAGAPSWDLVFHPRRVPTMLSSSRSPSCRQQARNSRPPKRRSASSGRKKADPNAKADGFSALYEGRVARSCRGQIIRAIPLWWRHPRPLESNS